MFKQNFIWSWLNERMKRGLDGWLYCIDFINAYIAKTRIVWVSCIFLSSKGKMPYSFCRIDHIVKCGFSVCKLPCRLKSACASDIAFYNSIRAFILASLVQLTCRAYDIFTRAILQNSMRDFNVTWQRDTAYTDECENPMETYVISILVYVRARVLSLVLLLT